MNGKTFHSSLSSCSCLDTLQEAIGNLSNVIRGISCSYFKMSHCKSYLLGLVSGIRQLAGTRLLNGLRVDIINV